MEYFKFWIAKEIVEIVLGLAGLAIIVVGYLIYVFFSERRNC